MTSLARSTLACSEANWPQHLTERLGSDGPSGLHLIGPPELLGRRVTALFCSAKTPGSAILPTHDAARRMRDDGVTVISGFHSPLEQECLKILLRGKQPIIVCPARAIETMRIPADCRPAYAAGRILFLSPFSKKPIRVSKEAAARRNDVVSALASEAYIAHITPGGEVARVAERLRGWGVPVRPK